MRHLILALMIALLPIRGWVGDVMATEMAAGHPAQVSAGSLAAIEKVAEHVHGTGAAALIDHETGTQQVAAMPDCAGHGDSPAAGQVHCESCANCQACHTVALSPVMASTAALAIPPALPHSPAARFASAVAALGQKPPIS